MSLRGQGAQLLEQLGLDARVVRLRRALLDRLVGHANWPPGPEGAALRVSAMGRGLRLRLEALERVAEGLLGQGARAGREQRVTEVPEHNRISRRQRVGAAQLVTGNGSYTSQLFYNLGTSATINTGTAASVRANGGNSIAQGGTAPWTTQTAYFEATSATEFLSFLSLGGSGEPPMALLDNVSLYAAPEPSSLALLGTGIAFGLIRRRRHLARAAVTRE